MTERILHQRECHVWSRQREKAWIGCIELEHLQLPVQLQSSPPTKSEMWVGIRRRIVLKTIGFPNVYVVGQHLISWYTVYWSCCHLEKQLKLKGGAQVFACCSAVTAAAASLLLLLRWHNSGLPFVTLIVSTEVAHSSGNWSEKQGFATAKHLRNRTFHMFHVHLSEMKHWTFEQICAWNIIFFELVIFRGEAS